MQLSVLFGAGSMCRYAHSSWCEGFVPTVKCLACVFVIGWLVPVSLFSIPLMLSGLAAWKLLGNRKMKLFQARPQRLL